MSAWHPDDAYDAQALTREEASVVSDREVLMLLRAAVAAAGGQRAYGRLHGCRGSLVCEVLAGRKPVPPSSSAR